MEGFSFREVEETVGEGRKEGRREKEREEDEVR